MVKALNMRAERARERGAVRRESLWQNIVRHPYLYLFAIPGIVFFIMIKIIPSLGGYIAWTEYNIFKGMWASPFVGWKHFEKMFRYPDFFKIFRNTFMIGLYRIVFGFPVPIILAFLLNEITHVRFKRFVQTTVYLPYFLSWVIISQLFMNILHPDSGLLNIFLNKIFGVEPIFFFAKEKLFQPIATVTYVWKTAGYQSIIYLAALTTIDPNLYESASIDGANRWQQVWKITIPCIMPTIIILLLLAIGQFLKIGFDQIYTLMNPLVQSTADIFDTYVYRVGLSEGRYSFATAIGLFKSMIGLMLLVGANFAVKRISGTGLFK